MAKSKILLEVKVLGVNPQVRIKDNSDRTVPEDKRLMIDVIPVTFLKNVEKITSEGGYLGRDVDVLKYNFNVVSDKEILKYVKPSADLLLEVEQTVFEFGKDAGRLTEKVVGVRPLVPVK